MTEANYIFLRTNDAATGDLPPSKMSEKEARLYLGAAVKNVDRAISTLKRGKMIRTRFATYTAQSV